MKKSTVFLKVLFLSLIPLFSACSGNSYKTIYPEGAGLSPLPESAEVYITENPTAAKCKIIKVADFKVASKTYSGSAKINKVVRKMARAKGGNAVLSYKFWIAPNGFAWAAPQSEGTIVSADLPCLKKNTQILIEKD